MMRPGTCMLFLAVLSLGSCYSLGPQEEAPLRYYQFRLPAPDSARRTSDLTVVLRAFSQDGALDRDEIHYRSSDVRGGYWPNDYWAEPVADMVRSAIQKDLDAWGGFSNVLLLDEAGRADLLLTAEVHRFEEVDRPDGSWEAVASMTFEVVSAKTGAVLYHRRMSEVEPCAARTVEEVVRALSRATGRIAAALRADLAGLPAGAEK